MSSVPSAVTAKLAALRAAADTAPATNTPTPPATNTPEGERVTLSRAEYNEMQAAAGRTQAASAREQLLALELEEAREALTQAQAHSKPVSTPSPSAAATPAPSTLTVDTSSTTFSDEENTQFGESRAYIEKVARLEAARIVNELMPSLVAQIDDVKKTASGVASSVHKQRADTFLDSVKLQVPNLAAITKDKHWEAYLDSVEPLSGLSMDRLLSDAVTKTDLARVVKLYRVYEEKYMAPLPTNDTGYAGASPSGGATSVPVPVPDTGKLKLSDRKKASEDFRKGRITYADLQQVQEKFKAAEAVGNVDLNA